MYDSQLALFTRESIHAARIQDFDPLMVVERLRNKEAQKVIAADFGGDKGVTKLFRVYGGELFPDTEYEDYVQGDGGEGYLESLEKTAAFATRDDIPIGISWGAPLDSTKPLHHPKAARFLKELGDKYEGDFAKLLPTLTACINDGPAGLIAGAVEIYRTTQVENVLFTINGGGLGMAVLNNNTIYSTEAGHVEGVNELNTYNQTTPCGVFGAQYVCIERLGANKAGIEAQWQTIKGSYSRAKDIEDRYKEGDELARELYDHSALVVAHMIAGTARAFDIELSPSQTAIVCHGGAFKFPGYGERISQILGGGGEEPRLVMTKDFVSQDPNTCLEGAAYAALAAHE
jgi:predicted NBD/HSP70 family sugar kinase